MTISQQVRLLIGSLFTAAALAVPASADTIAQAQASSAAGLGEHCEGMIGGLPPCAGDAPIPEPATMALVGIGLGVMLANHSQEGKRAGKR